MIHLRQTDFLIDRAASHQLFVRADAGNGPVIQYNNAVCVADGANPLGHDQNRRAGRIIAKGATQSGVGCEIQCAGAVVQYQHLRICRQSSRNREALALTAGIIFTALTDRRREALRQRANKILRLRRFQSLPQLLVRCRRIAPLQVAADGSRLL